MNRGNFNEINGSSESSSQKRDEFFHLFVSNESKILSYILTLVSNWNDAEDLLQDTSMVMWQKFEEFEMGTNFASWGMTIARFKVLAYYRKKHNRHVVFDEDLIESLSNKMMDVNEDKCGYDLEKLRECMSKLSVNDRKLIRIKYQDGSNTRKLAAKLGRSVNTLYKTFARIHLNLITCVKRKVSLE